MSCRSRAPKNAAPCRWQSIAFGREELLSCQLAFRVLHAGYAKKGTNLRMPWPGYEYLQYSIYSKQHLNEQSSTGGWNSTTTLGATFLLFLAQIHPVPPLDPHIGQLLPYIFNTLRPLDAWYTIFARD